MYLNLLEVSNLIGAGFNNLQPEVSAEALRQAGQGIVADSQLSQAAALTECHVQLTHSAPQVSTQACSIAPRTESNTVLCIAQIKHRAGHLCSSTPSIHSLSIEHADLQKLLQQDRSTACTSALSTTAAQKPVLIWRRFADGLESAVRMHAAAK